MTGSHPGAAVWMTLGVPSSRLALHIYRLVPSADDYRARGADPRG